MQEIHLNISETKSIYIKNNIDSISSPQKQIIAIHGLGMYHGTFDELYNYCTENNILVYLLDLPGFGKTGDNFDNYNDWLLAVQEVYKLAIKNNSGLPVYLLGHSLGGIIASVSMFELELAGVILSVPAFAPHPKSFNLFKIYSKYYFYKIYSLFNKSITPPKAKIKFPKEVYNSIKDNKTQANNNTLDGQLVTHYINPKVYIEISNLILKSWGYLLTKKLNTPLLLLLAGQDRTVLTPASKIYFKFLKNNFKEMCIFQKFGHDLFILGDSLKILQKIFGWMNNNSKTP